MARDQAVNNCNCISIRNQSGFSLIECLIYAAITSMVSIVLFSFFNNVTSSLRLLSDQEYDALTSWTARELLTKDMQMADPRSEWWHAEPNTTICHIIDECVGWQLHKGSLYRIKGDYDFNAKQWRSKSSALIIQNVKSFKVDLNKEEKIVNAVRYELETAYDKQIKTVMLENRRID